MAREYFNAYHSYLQAMEPLNEAERGRLFTACLTYSMTGEVQELRGNERFVFPGIRSQIDRDTEAYAEKCEKNRLNRMARYDANERQRPSTNVNERQRPSTNVHKEKEKTKTKAKTKDNPPLSPHEREGFSDAAQKTVDDWLRYKAERSEFYTETGRLKLLSGVKNKIAKNGDDAVIHAMDVSMANNWQGVVWERMSEGRQRHAASNGAVKRDDGAGAGRSGARPNLDFTEVREGIRVPEVQR